MKSKSSLQLQLMSFTVWSNFIVGICLTKLPFFPYFSLLDGMYSGLARAFWIRYIHIVYSKKGGRSCALRSAFCAFFARIFPLFSLGKHFGFFFMKGPSYFQSGLKVLSEQTCYMYYIWNWINVGQVFIENTTVKSHKNNI